MSLDVKVSGIHNIAIKTAKSKIRIQVRVVNECLDECPSIVCLDECRINLD